MKRVNCCEELYLSVPSDEDSPEKFNGPYANNGSNQFEPSKQSVVMMLRVMQVCHQK